MSHPFDKLPLKEVGENWADVKRQIKRIQPKALTRSAHINYSKHYYSI